MFEEARPFLLALAIGLLIGIERERAKADEPERGPLGSRTFTLVALLGAVAAYVDNLAMAVVLAAFTGGAVLAGYFRTPQREQQLDIGLTTEVAAMVTFILGYLAVEHTRLAIMLAVITLLLLALKPRIHAFAQAGLEQREVNAGLTLLVIAFVVLPLLPDRPVDPWGLVNPARLWLVFVLIAAIGFAGYVAVRLFGTRWGLALTGLFAGFSSSTAATVSMAQQARSARGLTGPLATGIVLANAISLPVQLLLVGVIHPGMVPQVTAVLLVPTFVGAIGTAAAVLVVGGGEGERGAVSLSNPLALGSSAKFAAVLAVMLVVTSAARTFFGSAGVLVASAIGGIGSMRGVTFAVASLAAGGTLDVRDAVLSILLAFVTNTIGKLFVVGWAGGRRILLAVAPPLVAMMVAAALTFFWTFRG